MENSIINQNAAAQQPSVLDLLLGGSVLIDTGIFHNFLRI